jgi:hypothetical protein
VTQITAIEAVNTNKLNVGGTTPLVGIGLAAGTTPLGLLHLEKSGGADLIMHQTVADTTGYLGAIQFGNNVDPYLATIAAVQDGSTDSAKLIFQTEAAGSTDKLTRLSISSAGLVSIGSESFTPHASADDFVIKPTDASAGMTIRCNGAAGTGSMFFAEGSNNAVGQITYNHQYDKLSLDAGTEIVLAKITKFSAGLVETNGVLKENLLSNSGFDVWSNSTLENATGTELLTGWTNNPTYPYETTGDSFTTSGNDITSAINTDGYGVAYATWTPTVGKLYRFSYDLTLTSGTAPTMYVNSTSSVGNGTIYQMVAGANSFVFECTQSGSQYINIMVSNWVATNFALASVTLYEVTPGCVADNGLAPDGWVKASPNIDVLREHSGSHTKGGSFYSLKTTTAAVDRYVHMAGMSPEGNARFAGRTVTCGCWAKTSTASHVRLRIYDNVAGAVYSSYHTGGGAWEWLELTAAINAAATAVYPITIYFDVSGVDAYISQPMLVLGNSIGSGNYSRPSGEIVNCEAAINVGTNDALASTDDKILNLEALSEGKIPKGAKAVNLFVITRNTQVADYQGVTYRPTSSWNSDGALQCLPLVNSFYQTASGVVNCDSNGDIYQTVTEAGSTISYNGVKVMAVSLR